MKNESLKEILSAVNFKLLIVLMCIPFLGEVIDYFTSKSVPYKDPGDYFEATLEVFVLIIIGIYISYKNEMEKRVKEAMHLETSKTDSLIKALDIGITIRDRDYNLTYQNEVVVNIFGDKRGQKCYKVFEGIDEVCEGCPVEKTFKDGNAHVLEKKVATPAGEFTFWENTSYPIKNAEGEIIAGLEVNRNITERKKEEEILLETQRDFLEAQKLAHVGNWEFDLKTGKFKASDETYRILGLSPKEPAVDWEYFINAVHGEDREFVDKSFNDAVSKHKPYTINYRIVLPDKSVKYVFTQGVVHHGNGGSIRVSGTIQDITERKKAEEEKEKLWQQLLHAQKLESIGRLTGGVAHDFNNILTAVIGYTQLGLERISNDRTLKKFLKTVLRSSDKAVILVQQLLAFSRKQVLEKKIHNLNIIVDDVSKMLFRLIGEDITLKLKIDLDVNNVQVDAGQIEQVLMNLAVNARHAMPEGGSLTIKTEDVEIDRKFVRKHPGIQTGSYVLLTVKDTGMGMNDYVKEKIFEPFFTTKDAGKGTGLGLSTVYGIVKQHGGYILVKSETGKGTTFKIYFPAIKGKIIEFKETKVVQNIKGTETILIVDDEDMIRGYMIDALKPLGYKVITASSGEEALRIIDKEEDKIDLLITDVIMTGMTGWELYDKVKQKNPGIKQIFMSGYFDSVDIYDKIQEANLPFICKPIRNDVLFSKIKETLHDEYKEDTSFDNPV